MADRRPGVPGGRGGPPVSAPSDYFADPGSMPPPTLPGRFLDLAAEVPAVSFRPGLVFRPVLGQGVLVMAVAFDPHAEAPRHAHEEEQVTVVVEGELEFEIAGETRLLRPGMVAVIPPRVPHAARTHDVACLEYDTFHPPRQALLDLAAAGGAAAEGGAPRG